MIGRFALLVLFSVGLVLTPVAPVFSQEGDVSPEAARKASSIARKTMSPFCPGRTLSDCPSEYAAEWRRDIRTMVQEGMSAEEIQRTLEKRAGGNLSGIPNRESSYALPLILATLAALFLYFIFVRLRRKDHDGPPPDDSSKEEKGTAQEVSAPSVDDARLEQELASEEDD